MPLDPQVRTLLDSLARQGLPLPGTVPVNVLRVSRATRRLALPPGPDARVKKVEVPAAHGPIQARIYWPDVTGPLAALVWFHGGGFTIGSVAESEADCRHLAVLSSSAVVSVEYRLAPEDPFPAGLEDCLAAVSWVHAHARELGIDPNRIGVGGDSAGGNLATVVARLARDAGGPPLGLQVLVYPITDMSALDTPSYVEFANGPYLTHDAMAWFRDQYLPNEKDWTNPSVSPLLLEDLAGLPPAFIVTAEIDPLRDEAEAYAHRLKDAGGRVRLRRYDGMIHGFFSMYYALDGGKQVLRDVAAAIREGL
jgi:acetyl esterase/lipase